MKFQQKKFGRVYHDNKDTGHYLNQRNNTLGNRQVISLWNHKILESIVTEASKLEWLVSASVLYTFSRFESQLLDRKALLSSNVTTLSLTVFGVIMVGFNIKMQMQCT